MLPRDTWLGRLSVFDVYAEHNGPRLFAVVNESGSYFLGVSTDEDEDSAQWLYVPVSRSTLGHVRSGEIDVAVPFREPHGGYLFRVTTFASPQAADSVVAVRRKDVVDADLPHAGFPLALAAVPDQWRLEALQEAPASGEQAHETRMIPVGKHGNVLEPNFVASLLRKWTQFVHAAVPKPALRLAAVAPGSLRAIFAAPKAKQTRVIETYEALVECGRATDRLREKVKSATLASAYFDLVRFVADAECDLELATERAVATPVLKVVRLSREVAAIHGAALAEPREQHEDRKFLAAVMAGSVTRSSLELELEQGEKLDGVVSADGRKFIRGLRIGSYYHFDMTLTTRVDSPSSAPRIEFGLRLAPTLDLGQVDQPAAPPRSGRSKAKIPLAWHKKLSMTDALRAPSGSVRAFVPLTRSGHAIDPTWFRTKMFGDYEWVHSEDGEERATVEMTVTFNRTNEGPQAFELSHDLRRARHNNDPVTRLHWNAPMRRLLRNNDAIKRVLTLRRDANGDLFLEISEAAK